MSARPDTCQHEARQPRRRPGDAPARGDGFALVNVLILATVITMFATANLSGMLPLLEKSASLKQGNTARALAEAALDYTLGQLNAALAAGEISQMDPGTVPGSAKTTTLDAATVLGWTPGQGPKPQVSVLVENLPAVSNTNMDPYPNDPAPPPAFQSQFGSNSILYDPNLTSLAFTSNPTLLNPGNQQLPGAPYPNPFRRVTATVVYGAAVTNVRVILQPIVQAGTSSNNKAVQFPFGLFGTQRVEFVGQAGSNSYNSPDPRLFADMGTYGAGNEVGTGSTQRGVAEGGYHMEFPNPLSYQTQQIQQTAQTYNATPVSQAPWVQIMGNVFSNGDTTGYWPRAPQSINPAAAQSWNNVFGLPDGVYAGAPDGQGGAVPQSASGWQGGIVDSYENYGKPQLPPVPQAAPGTPSLGTVTLGSGQTLTITPGVSSVTYSQNGMQIPPGDYILNSLNMSGNASIVIDPAAGPSRFFIQGATAGNTAVSVGNNANINMKGINGASNMNEGGNNGVTNGASPNQLAITPQSTINETSGSAANLQMYYNGTQNIYLLGNERMTIYAPNATVNVGAQPVTTDANYYGAIVGGVTRVISDFNSHGGAFFHYDFKLRPPGMTFIDPTRVGTVSTLIQPAPSVITGYRAVTWQEARLAATDPSQASWL